MPNTHHTCHQKPSPSRETVPFMFVYMSEMLTKNLKNMYIFFCFISPNFVGDCKIVLIENTLAGTGSFHFLLQNEHIGFVRSKMSPNELWLCSAFISWRIRSFSEMSIFSLFSS
jgi:hypothetical protein